MREESSGTLYLERDVDNGTIALRLTLPAVVSVDLRILCPASVRSRHTRPEYRYANGVRLAALPGVIASKRKPLRVLQLRELIGDANPRAQYVGYRFSPTRPSGRMVNSVAELVELLGTEAKVI